MAMLAHAAAVVCLANTTEPSEGWRYAGWIAIDVRLLLFVGAVSVLIAVGAAALWVRSGRWRELLAAFFLAFIASFIGLAAIFNSIASHPVIVVERLFPFP